MWSGAEADIILKTTLFGGTVLFATTCLSSGFLISALVGVVPERTFKAMGAVEKGDQTQDGYISVQPNILVIVFNENANGRSISATRHAEDLPENLISESAIEVEKVEGNLFYKLGYFSINGLRHLNLVRETKLFDGHQFTWLITPAPAQK